MIEIKDLCKRFSSPNGEIIALDNLSLKISDGEFVAFTGKSGAGKTTLLNMIGGLDKPDCGSVLIDGVDISRLSEKKKALLRRRKIGVIYQFYNLIPELTVCENITLPIELDGGKIDEAWLSELLCAVDLSERGGDYPDVLSGGQQQRAAIARAVFSLPSIILADEPTGNLDSENADQVLSLLKDMNEKYKITVLMVTHSAEAASYANRVIKIENGRICDDGRGVI